MSDSRPSRLVAALRTVVSSALGRVPHFDSWTNLQIGQSVSGYDKVRAGTVTPLVVLDDQTLSDLFHTHDLAERMVTIFPEETLREGFNVQTGVPELDAAIGDKCSELDVRGKFLDGSIWGRCFGGAAVLIGADDGRDADRPLVAERARDIDYLYTVDRRCLQPRTWYAYGHPKFGQAETYAVTLAGGYSYDVSTVHESRLVLFGGSHTGTSERQQNSGWDLSVLQRAHDIIRSFDLGWDAVSTLLADGNQAVFKVSGLSEMAGAGNENALLARMRLLNQFRSVYRALILDSDANESFERQGANFSGIPDVLEKLILRLSACANIPATRLMGQSPAGLSATGESDLSWFHSAVRSQQTIELAPKVRRLVEVWLQTKAGRAIAKELPKTLTVTFPPLWSESALEQAQREKAIADRDAVYLLAGVLTKQEVKLHRFRPGGFADEIQISEEAITASEASLDADLKKIEADAAKVKADIAADALAAKQAVESPEDVDITESPLDEDPDNIDTMPPELAALADPSLDEDAPNEEGT